MKQRQLTQEEIDIAHSLNLKPTHYIIDETGVCFENASHYQYLIGRMLSYKAEKARAGIEADAQPIPRKAFDLSEHEFSDTVGFVELNEGELTVNCTGCNYILLYKDDAIAIAKALGVTAEDFK